MIQVVFGEIHPSIGGYEEMKVMVLQGSPRKHGNTAQLAAPVIAALEKSGAEITERWLYDYDIHGCLGCKACQNVPDSFGCIQKDDMNTLFEETIAADLILLVTPIYCWYCTAPMKAFLDRFIYGSCKFYGKQKMPPLTTGKTCALITTLGYPIEMSHLLSDGVKMLCKHGKMTYGGALVGRDLGKGGDFLTPELQEQAEAFAAALLA
jgi:multimeric flavodoxin WrbA